VVDDRDGDKEENKEKDDDDVHEFPWKW